MKQNMYLTACCVLLFSQYIASRMSLERFSQILKYVRFAELENNDDDHQMNDERDVDEDDEGSGEDDEGHESQRAADEVWEIYETFRANACAFRSPVGATGDMFEQFKTHMKVKLHLRNWAVRVVITIFNAAILCARAIWIHHAKPRESISSAFDFAPVMIDKLLESADVPQLESGFHSDHWAIHAGQVRTKRHRCWVCKTKKPNITCSGCKVRPILCLGCHREYHKDPSKFHGPRKRKRQRAREEESENELSESNHAVAHAHQEDIR